MKWTKGSQRIHRDRRRQSDPVAILHVQSSIVRGRHHLGRIARDDAVDDRWPRRVLKIVADRCGLGLLEGKFSVS